MEEHEKVLLVIEYPLVGTLAEGTLSNVPRVSVCFNRRKPEKDLELTQKDCQLVLYQLWTHSDHESQKKSSIYKSTLIIFTIYTFDSKNGTA